MIQCETKALALEHALRDAPREACGLVILAGDAERYIPCRNLAKDISDFELDPADFAAAEDSGEILSVVHSHPLGNSKPTQADLVACEASGLPWDIVALPSGVWTRIEPKGYRAPLIGRTFHYGVLDCYTLIRDWYALERGIELPDFDRGVNGWWKTGGNIYMDNFRKGGFEEIEGDPLPGDVILMQIRSKVPNHGAIYLGNDLILHHVIDQLSRKEIFGGYWKKNTRLVIRYQGKK
jgi:cell wall-associated NlpC family hydrolase